MGNYLSAEWYRITRNKNYIAILLICLFLTISGNIYGNYLVKRGGSDIISSWGVFFRGINFLTGSFFIYGSLVSALIAAGEELKLGTIGRTVEHGIRRETIFIAKMLISILCMIFLIFALLGVHLLMTKLYFGWTERVVVILMRRLYSLVVKLPGILIFLSLATAIFTNMKSSILAVFSYFGLIYLSQLIFLPFLLFQQEKIVRIGAVGIWFHPINIVPEIIESLESVGITSSLLGIYWIAAIIIFVIGVLLYRKRDFS